MKKSDIIALTIFIALAGAVMADFLGTRDNKDWISHTIKLPLDSAGIPVTPDSFQVIVDCDTCLKAAYIARATSNFFTIGVDTETVAGLIHWKYDAMVDSIDSNKGNVGYSGEVRAWTKKLPTQTFFSFHEADTGEAANVANVKLATTYSKATLDSIQNYDDWIAQGATLTAITDSIYGNHLDILRIIDSVYQVHIAALLAYAEAKRAAESLDVAATAGDVATTLADTLIARGYAGGTDSTNSSVLFDRLWSAYQAALAARDSAHAAVLKAIIAADSGHAAVLAAVKAADSGHAANLTAYKAADSGHAAVVAAQAARDSAHEAVLQAIKATDSAHAAVLAALTTPGDSTKSPTLFQRIQGAYSMAKDARDTIHAGNVAIANARAYIDSLNYWSGYRLNVWAQTRYHADADTLIFRKVADTLGFEVFYHPSGTAGQAPDSTKFWPVDSLR